MPPMAIQHVSYVEYRPTKGTTIFLDIIKQQGTILTDNGDTTCTYIVNEYGRIGAILISNDDTT